MRQRESQETSPRRKEETNSTGEHHFHHDEANISFRSNLLRNFQLRHTKESHKMCTPRSTFNPLNLPDLWWS